MLFLVHGQVISLEQNERGIDQRSSPAKWQLPKLAFTVTSEAATNSPFRTDQDLAISTYSSLLTDMHSPLDSITHILGICTHTYTGAHVSSTYARTHVLMPRRLLRKPTAVFYVYLFLSLVVFPFINTSTLRYKKWAIFTSGPFKKKKKKE